MKTLKMHIDDKVLTPLLIALLHAVEFFSKTIGKTAVERVQCRMGGHPEWLPVDGVSYLRFCPRCGAVDDIRTDGIDGLTRMQRKRLKRSIKKAYDEEMKIAAMENKKNNPD